MPAHFELLRTLVQEGDLPTLKRRAHLLKGSLGCFGCVAMTTRLTRLMEQDHLAPELAEPLHEELVELWEQSLASIRQWELSVPSFTT